MVEQLYKYPRTQHLQGSRFQFGDDDLLDVALSEIVDRFVIIEEKCDGANAALSFSLSGQLQLQSRGHFLTGGARERHFNLFKQWANACADQLWPVLGSRYVLYGEWVYAKHTIFYDRLPHYFLEFDLFDTQNRVFLSTARRRERLAELPIVSVPVIYSGTLTAQQSLAKLIGHSHFIGSAHLAQLRHIAAGLNLDVERVVRETDPSPVMEGLYIKVETQDHTVGRYKFIRSSFLSAIVQADSHWLQRPIIPNQLAPGVDLFAEL